MPHPDCVPLAQLCDDTGATTGPYTHHHTPTHASLSLTADLRAGPPRTCVPFATLSHGACVGVVDAGWLVDRLEAWSCAEALPLCVLPRVWALLSSLCLHLAHEDGEPLPLQASGEAPGGGQRGNHSSRAQRLPHTSCTHAIRASGRGD
jgi:hypothetical protein